MVTWSILPSAKPMRGSHDMVVVDLRGQDRATGSIEGTINVPALEVLGKLKEFAGAWQEKPIVAFFCQYSAHRAPTVANYYRNAAPPQQKVLVMDGGFRGWEAMELPHHQGGGGGREVERPCFEGGCGRGQHGRRRVGAKAAPNSGKEPTLLPRSCCRTCSFALAKLLR